MAYIGNQPAESFTSFATQEFSTSATTSYTLDHAVTNENEIALFVNNVRQQPGSGKAYTATGTALTLSAATASTDTMYCVFLGRALQTVTPATNTINNAMVSSTAAIATTKLGTGAVLQVVQTFKSDAFSSTSDGFFDITGLSVAITPSSSSNKVLIISDLAIGSSDLYSYNHGFKVLRGSTSVGISTAGSTNYSGGINMYLSGGQYPHIFGTTKIFLDSPSTTSATTYKVQGTKNNSSGTFYLNRKGDGTTVGGASSITVMEVAG